MEQHPPFSPIFIWVYNWSKYVFLTKKDNKNYYLVYVIHVNLSETAEVDNAVFGKMTSKDLIVMLSTSANIVSRHTSFVGVDKVRQPDHWGRQERPPRSNFFHFHAVFEEKIAFHVHVWGWHPSGKSCRRSLVDKANESSMQKNLKWPNGFSNTKEYRWESL